MTFTGPLESEWECWSGCYRPAAGEPGFSTSKDVVQRWLHLSSVGKAWGLGAWSGAISLPSPAQAVVLSVGQLVLGEAG